MIPRHKVFISYHHANDEGWKNAFLNRFGHLLDDWSVRLGDIPDGLATDTIRQKIRDEYLRDSTVTVVLIGTQTWQRKHVDWEISSSLRETRFSSRSGLLGIYLPSRADHLGPWGRYTSPPRLMDNVGGHVNFASLMAWTDDGSRVAAAIHAAYQRRNVLPPPDNSRDLFGYNRSGASWT